jgi:hypothetical protein
MDGTGMDGKIEKSGQSEISVTKLSPSRLIFLRSLGHPLNDAPYPKSQP